MIALAGCGGGSGHTPAPARTAPKGASPPRGGNDAAPYGALSVAEFRAIVREYRRLRPLSDGHNDAAALAHGRRVCGALRAPDTQLVARVRVDCDNAIAFFGALRRLEQAGDACRASQTGRFACMRDRYVAMADAIKATTDGAAAINDELRSRGITGLCARSIGITEQQLGAYRRAEQAAREAADAIVAGDPPGLERATQELTDSLSAGSADDPLAGIERGCRTAKPKPLPRVPGEGGISA